MEASTPHDEYVELLRDKVREDNYPSGELMDRIEAAVRSREQAADYLEVLIEKVNDSHYPSKQLLDRIERGASGFSCRRGVGGGGCAPRPRHCRPASSPADRPRGSAAC